jgi:hypothetical protein
MLVATIMTVMNIASVIYVILPCDEEMKPLDGFASEGNLGGQHALTVGFADKNRFWTVESFPSAPKAACLPQKLLIGSHRNFFRKEGFASRCNQSLVLELGDEVIVAHARKARLIGESRRRDDSP